MTDTTDKPANDWPVVGDHPACWKTDTVRSVDDVAWDLPAGADGVAVRYIGNGCRESFDG